MVVKAATPLIFKVIQSPSMEDFDELLAETRRQARKAGLKNQTSQKPLNQFGQRIKIVRIIIDTNVLASGLFFKGIPFKILQGIKLRKYKTIVSQGIIDEYKNCR